MERPFHGSARPGGMEHAQRLSDFPDLFERVLVPAIFEPYARDLVERGRPFGPSDRILDLGCGTGIVARVLRERLGGGARLTGVDINAPMLAKARSLAPDIEWVEGNAVALPFADRSFEVVLAQQVLQFVPDRAAAIREIRRVLVPGGRIIASTWRARQYQPLFHAAGEIAEKHLGPGNDKRFSLDAPALRDLFSTGFTDVVLETASIVEKHVAFPIQGNLAGAGYTNIDPAVMAVIEAETRAAFARLAAADGSLLNHGSATVVVGRVP